MTNSQRLAMVRACLTRWLSQHRDSQREAAGNEASPPTLPGPFANPGPFAESILIRDGFYCGRRFDAGSHRAIWFVEEDELKIFTAAGQLAEVLDGHAITQAAEAPAETPQPADASPATAPRADHARPEVLPLPAPAGDTTSRRAA